MMKSSPLAIGIVSGILIGLCFMGESKNSIPANDLIQVERSAPNSKAKLDPILFDKIQSLYPDVIRERRNCEPYFSNVQVIARVSLRDGTERLAVWVHVIVPAMVDHGWGELLIYKDAHDALPMVRKSSHSLSIMSASEVHLIRKQWLQFGTSGPLVSLVNEESLKHFGQYGTKALFQSLSALAVQSALGHYIKDGREAFLQRVPIAKHRERHVRTLPNRIRRVEMYHSLPEDIRSSGFKYSSTWEGTILIRVVPADEPEKLIILEIGTKGWSEGISSDDVELHVWETRTDEPTDRPTAEFQWSSKVE